MKEDSACRNGDEDTDHDQSDVFQNRRPPTCQNKPHSNRCQHKVSETTSEHLGDKPFAALPPTLFPHHPWMWGVQIEEARGHGQLPEFLGRTFELLDMADQSGRYEGSVPVLNNLFNPQITLFAQITLFPELQELFSPLLTLDIE